MDRFGVAIQIFQLIVLAAGGLLLLVALLSTRSKIQDVERRLKLHQDLDQDQIQYHTLRRKELSRYE